MASIIDAFVSSLRTALSDAGITDEILNTLSVADLFRLAANTEIVGGGGGTDDQTAAEVSIADAGTLFTATDVEEALAELRTIVNGIPLSAEGSAAALDQAHINDNSPHEYHTRSHVGDGLGDYVLSTDIDHFISVTEDEADPDLTGLPAGTMVFYVPPSA